MPLFNVDLTETVAYTRVYLVEAPSEDEARAAAERGENIKEDTIKTNGVVNRVVSQAAPYAGGRFVIEQVPDDPEYWHVIDSTNGEVVDCYGDKSDAQEDATALNFASDSCMDDGEDE
jgi:hypothetical protein